MFHEKATAGAWDEANAGEQVANAAPLYDAHDPEGASYDPAAYDGSGGDDGPGYGGASATEPYIYPGMGADGGGAAAADVWTSYTEANGGQDYAVADGYGAGYGAATSSDAAESAATASAAGYGWPADPEGVLALLQEQQQQYRSWVAQCASTALTALDPSNDAGASSYWYGGEGCGSAAAAVAVAAGLPAGTIPEDVPGLVAAMDVTGNIRQYLVSLKAAAEAVREAARVGANFESLSLPVAEVYDDPADAAAGEAAEAEFVSAAYGVTTAVAAARGVLEQLTELAGGPAAALIQEALEQHGLDGHDGAAGGSVGGQQRRRLEAPLERRLERVGAELCRRLRQEAAAHMAHIQWPPPLADGGGAELAAAAGGAGGEVASDGGACAFRGLESHPVQARRLVGVLTALTHFQMAVEHRTEFYRLLAAGAGPGSEGSETELQADATASGAAAKPLLWAAQALAEPVAAKLRAHFHPAAPTGRLDRPAWLYGTVLEFVRRHGHALSSLDDMLACLQLKPHYNMPAEFARAIQEAVLELLRDQRVPAILKLRNQAEAAEADLGADAGADASVATAAAAAAAAEADALLLGLMDASAAYDIAMLPLLGATGPRVEADAARAQLVLSAAAAGGAVLQRRRACDQFDPTAVGTADMHARYVAMATAAATAACGRLTATAETTHGSVPTASAAAASLMLSAWAAAEGAAALRSLEAVVYDESSLAAAEEVACQALGGGEEEEEDGGAAGLSQPSGLRGAAGGGGGGGARLLAPWQRDTWPPVLAREAAILLEGLVARSKWLSADPVRQRDFLEAATGPVLALLRRRLGRLVDTAVARGEVVSEEGLPKVCAALCAAHFLDDHLHSLLLTDLAPLVHALNTASAAAVAAADDEHTASGPPTPSSSFTAAGGGGVPAGKLGSGGGGFWGGLIAAAAGGGGATASPARQALRDGVTALAAGAAASVASAAGGGAAAATPSAPVLGEHVRSFSRLHRDGCLKVARELALGFGRCSVAYRHAIEVNPQFPFTPESDTDDAAPPDGDGGVISGGDFGRLARPASSITPSFAPALLFLQTSLDRLSRCCDKATFADVWRGAALSINRFMFNFIATESRFTRPGARQFAADVAGLAQLFAPYSRRGAAAAAASRPGSFSMSGLASSAAGGGGGGGGGQHFRELQAAARLLCLGDEEAADVMRRASAAAVAVQAAAAAAGAPSSATPTKSARPPRPGGGGGPASSPPSFSSQPQPQPHGRRDPVRSGMSADPVLSSAGLACLSPLQIMNVIEHRF